MPGRTFVVLWLVAGLIAAMVTALPAGGQADAAQVKTATTASTGDFGPDAVKSADLAVDGWGDQAGYHVRVARENSGFGWQEPASSAPRNSRGADEGFARIERVEHLAEDLAREVFTPRSIDWGPVPVVWCHGVPGPLVLRGGDVHVLDHANPDRVRHDEAHPSWPPAERVLLRGAVAAGHKPHRWRREPTPRTGHITWANADEPRRASYRATGFTKLAAALLVRDYLRIHRDR